jgi:hypothetical protein
VETECKRLTDLKWTVDILSDPEINLLQEGPIWVSGMLSMLRGQCLVQRFIFSLYLDSIAIKNNNNNKKKEDLAYDYS